MISPYKLSATQGIVDFRLPIADLKEPFWLPKSSIENRKSKIDWVADGLL
jgi:hypothetical protein